jgi:glycosyltransferase involved in cell wall biosynthesis
LRQAAAIICVSHAEAQLLGVEKGIHSPVVIPNGIDPVMAPSVDAATRRTALMAAGRAEAYKHFDTVIDAMALLPASFHLSLVASGPGYGALKARAGASPSRERIEVLAQLPRDELDRTYAAAGTFISLSEREAFGMAPLEAASAGCQLILSDIPAHREIGQFVDHASISFVPSGVSADVIAHAIQASSGRTFAAAPPRLPSWPEVAEATLAVYRKVIR